MLARTCSARQSIKSASRQKRICIFYSFGSFRSPRFAVSGEPPTPHVVVLLYPSTAAAPQTLRMRTIFRRDACRPARRGRVSRRALIVRVGPDSKGVEARQDHPYFVDDPSSFPPLFQNRFSVEHSNERPSKIRKKYALNLSFPGVRGKK